MPKRTDISSILIIGAGPIVIGQACEFDYSGTQAVKTLKAEGYRVILVNSNPATIMTDPELADATYIEPILPEFVEKIIAKERPDALLPTMGGQTALNCAKALAESGVLEKYGVELIGADLAAINKAEDRGLFNEAMARIGLETPKNALAHTMAEARAAVEKIGLPVIIRPSFTMGGAGGGVAYNMEEFEQIAASGLDASPTTEILIDESVLGWKEYEMEVVRDKNDNCIIVCSIENIDPMGVHTGDSITVAPALTLTDKEYQIMRDASIAVLREIGVETGGSNVQFAVNPENGRMIVIEMNPRVSRSSALASKATGFPIAKVAAKLAVGYTLDEVANDVVAGKKPSPIGRGLGEGKGVEIPSDLSVGKEALTPRPLPRGEGAFIPASFEPTIDYVVTKIPRFAFEKFPAAPRNLTTAMKSVGEAMAMGRCFAESMQKALRSLETGLTGFNEREIPEGADAQDVIMTNLSNPTPDRILWAAEALRRGFTVEEICGITKYDPWFIRQIEEIINAEEQVRGKGLPADIFGMLELKKLGFSDLRLAQLTGKKEAEITAHRHALGVRPVFKRIDTCAGEFAAITPYLYSCYESPVVWGNHSPPAGESKPHSGFGGGPTLTG
ncbi:MAG: carbamoyl-phosphate synthase large subunit, partial [Rickettsiales bacterium]|nr:carbamoyl-phosphate synthase large subunit [Rickettsiales bacterium]